MTLRPWSLLRRLAVAALAIHAPAAFSQQAAPAAVPAPSSNPHEMQEIVVIGNPVAASSLFDMVAPASVLQGQGLLLKRRSTLGETLGDMPGVSSSYFGPNASRPVIRGLDGDRIRILQNGVGMQDVSSLSQDHAVAIDPLVVDRIEVVRGAAALLYGGNAVGGVVNVVDGRIPGEPVTGFSGLAEPRIGGAANERAGSVVLDGGTGGFALHADAYARRTDNLRIRGNAVSAQLRDRINRGVAGFSATPESLAAVGRLPNSASASDGGSVGGSFVWDKGYAGLSWQGANNNYGTVVEPRVRIAMQSERVDLAGEARELGSLVQTLKFKYGRTDYTHRELDNGALSTTFRNKGHEGRVEAVHAPFALGLGELKGAFGLQFGNAAISALGDEALVPRTVTDNQALFLFEELALGALKLTAGGRAERSVVKSDGGGPVDASTGSAKFGAARTRSFAPRSLSAGALYALAPGFALALNHSSTERAPSYAELFANGPHAATNEYQVGNASFGTERSRSTDLALRWRDGPNSASVSVFQTKFSNYITLFRTGNNRGNDGELNPVDADGDGVADGSRSEIKPESQFRAVPALFRGAELQSRMRLLDRGEKLDLELGVDTVRATNDATGQALPRIAPMRYKAALQYSREAFGARLDLVRAAAQRRVEANELPTDAYTLVNASLSYRFRPAPNLTWEGFLRADNLLNVEARNHVSPLKDIAPLPGRGFTLGLRGAF